MSSVTDQNETAPFEKIKALKARKPGKKALSKGGSLLTELS